MQAWIHSDRYITSYFCWASPFALLKPKTTEESLIGAKQTNQILHINCSKFFTYRISFLPKDILALSLKSRERN